MSVLNIRKSLAYLAGLLFGGSRDLYQVFGYRNTIGFADVLAKYSRQDITARIVNALAQGTWLALPRIYIANSEGSIGISDNNPFEDWNKQLRPNRALRQGLIQADKLASMDDYSLLILGFSGSSRLSTPVEGGDAKLLYARAYPASFVKVVKWGDDPSSPRFGLPIMYRIEPQSSISASSAGTDLLQGLNKEPFEVHWTRTVHIADDPLLNELQGNPLLIKIFNLLDDLMKVAGGSAETFWITANRGMQVDVDKEMDLDDDEAAALEDEIDEYIHNLRRYIRTRGVDIKTLGSDVPDPSGPFDVLIALISAATGIPKRVLMGSELGSLASEQDRANWSNRIEERRVNYAEPIFLYPLLDRLDRAGVINLPEEELVFRWPDPFRMSTLERAQTAAQLARAAINFSKQAGNDGKPAQIITPEKALELMRIDELN